MTHVVSHRGRTLLGACSVAAAMMFAQAGWAHGVGGGMGAGGSAMMAQPRPTSLQPPVMTAPHPIDPSGHLPGLASGRVTPAAREPITGSHIATDPPAHTPGLTPVVRTPITGSRIPVTTVRFPSSGTTNPITEGQRPTVARRFFTPDGGMSGVQPRVSSDTPTKVGGDPTTGTEIVDSPIK